MILTIIDYYLEINFEKRFLTNIRLYNVDNRQLLSHALSYGNSHIKVEIARTQIIFFKKLV